MIYKPGDKVAPFQVIYADPPWHFQSWSNKGETRGPHYIDPATGKPKHYNCMSLDDIHGFFGTLNVPVARDCVLFLWGIDSMLPAAFSVMEEWGFQYKTIAFTWAKTTKDGRRFSMGLGHWTRANPESCLLGVRGAPTRLDRGVRQLIVSPRQEHSKKPDRVATDIERLVAGPYLELFARRERDGWYSLGDELK